MDAIKARKRAAKAFSASLERRNAELRQHSGRDAATPPAHTPANNPTTTVSREASLSQIKVERHIAPKAQEPATTAGATATTPCSVLTAAHTPAPPASHLEELKALDSKQQEQVQQQQQQQQQEQQQQHTRSSLVEGTAALVAAPQHATGDLAHDTATQADAAGSGHGVPRALAGRPGQGCTFLTEPGSPLRLGAAALQPLLDAAAVAAAGQGTVCSRGVCDAGAAALAPAADVQSASAAGVAGSTGVHVQQSCASVDASSKLLCCAHCESEGVPTAAAAAGSVRGRAPGREGPVTTATGAFSSTAAGIGSTEQWACNSYTGSTVQRPLSPFQQLGSPTRRPGSPHWSPVPPKTQLQSPVVVRPM
jgi:hypothetical protein